MPNTSVRYCLNTSTIHGEKIDVREQVKIAAKAGYDGIELWMRDVQRFQESGGKLTELAALIKDSSLRVESAIAFAPWIVNDEATRGKALEQAANDMRILKQLGGTRIAAPPAGATDGDKLDLDRVAERYRALLEVGGREGILPQLEVWGFSKNLSRLCEVLYVTSAADHPNACVLPDVYHLYKGGSHFHDLAQISGRVVHVFHMNDYPATPARDKITDADRIYPLEGIAPVAAILKTMIQAGFSGVLSLELFNRTYWEQDPQLVANTGLAKMKLAWSKATDGI
jgi:2-keto-myo-inositol isomerase